MKPNLCPQNTTLIPETQTLQKRGFSKTGSEVSLYQANWHVSLRQRQIVSKRGTGIYSKGLHMRCYPNSSPLQKEHPPQLPHAAAPFCRRLPAEEGFTSPQLHFSPPLPLWNSTLKT